jgi:hypothetical protein
LGGSCLLEKKSPIVQPLACFNSISKTHNNEI